MSCRSVCQLHPMYNIIVNRATLKEACTVQASKVWRSSELQGGLPDRGKQTCFLLRGQGLGKICCVKYQRLAQGILQDASSN